MKKILVIDDNSDITELAVILLENEGYEVECSSEFAGYEKTVDNSNCQLVLLDLNLDGFSGKDICRYIKRQQHLENTKVVLISADHDIEEVREEVCADDFIRKPFDIRDFLGTVNKNMTEGKF
jgi:DNA-binding response OmpR family regulator